jgi:hypothetical protein
MASALGSVKPAQAAAAVPRPKPEPVKPAESRSANIAAAREAATQEVKAAVVPEAKTAVVPEAKATANPVVVPVMPKSTVPPVKRPGPPAPVAAKPIVPLQAPDVRHRIVRPVATDPRRTRLWVACGVGVVLLLLLVWRMMRNEPSSGANAASAPIIAMEPVKTGERPATPAPSASAPTSAAKPTDDVNAAGNAALSGRTQWRVVAYTYNREEQAQKKASSLAKRDPSLNPQVFTPNGRAPYLVTVGGPMTREQAEAFKRKAWSAGLPRDLYAQNYAH